MPGRPKFTIREDRGGGTVNRLKWVIGFIIIGYLLFSFDIRNVVFIIYSADIRLILAALIIYSVTFVILSMRWKKVLDRMGIRLPLKEAYPAFVAGVFLSDFTPARVGDLGRAYLIRKRLDPKIGIASVVVDRYMDILSILLLSLIGLIILGGEKGISGMELVYVLLSLSVILAVFLLGYLMLWFKRRKVLQIIQGFSTRSAKLKNPSSYLLKLIEGLERLTSPRSLIFTGIIYTSGAWITHALRLTLIILAVDAVMPFHLLPFLLPMVTALSLLPVSPGGLGLVEGGMVAILGVYGIDPATGLSIALIDRGITVFFHSLGALKAAFSE